jgi:hypothetical protein
LGTRAVLGLDQERTVSPDVWKYLLEIRFANPETPLEDRVLKHPNGLELDFLLAEGVAESLTYIPS